MFSFTDRINAEIWAEVTCTRPVPLNEMETGLGIDPINSGIKARERFISRSAFLDVDSRRANNDESNKPHPAIALLALFTFAPCQPCLTREKKRELITKAGATVAFIKIRAGFASSFVPAKRAI